MEAASTSETRASRKSRTSEDRSSRLSAVKPEQNHGKQEQAAENRWRKQMNIKRSSQATNVALSERFTGVVHSDLIAEPEGPSAVIGSIVHFTPGARTAWHVHPNGQTIFVLEGVGRCQRRGGPVEEIRPGDRVFFEPGEEHWHGAAPDRLMSHIAVLDVDDHGGNATWGSHVTDDEYLAGAG
jgi:quercetin dioxygenase-like cupin family protein